MNQQALEKYLWGAATLLRGTIDAGDYKQYIFPLLFYKRICDVYDEEFETALKESDGDREYAGFAEHHRFQIPKGAHWSDVRETTVNVGMALQEAMRNIEQANPDTLYGIFGDASWTNKNRLSDETLTDLIEHYSQHKLDNASVPNDQLGNAYEYLIKEFADDSGHTAAEFYTNRTVVKLMTMIMNPQPGESAYDPTCGSGGLLLNCALHLKDEGKEYRTLKLYGQEINMITSAIARMNMFMHGIEEFQIVRGDTLANPAFLEHDQLKKFNVILANPPYSIKAWDQKSFTNDPYGRNIWGVPPQGCADYAFEQHIHQSLDAKNGRSICLWPQGFLDRNSENDIRENFVKSDRIDAVIGLGRNLFYNSGMESCLLVSKTQKAAGEKGHILFVNASHLVKKEKTMSFLAPEHIQQIYDAVRNRKDVEGLAKLVTNEEVLERRASLNVTAYVSHYDQSNDQSFAEVYDQWEKGADQLRQSMSQILNPTES